MLLLSSLSLFFIWVAITVHFEPIHLLMKIFSSLFFLLFGLSIPWLIFSTYYVLTEDRLIIRTAIFKYAISLDDIVEVYPTHNPLSAPAFSLDRLRIKFKGSRFGAMISPKDKEMFYKDLLLRCPHLTRKDNKLVATSDTSSG